MPISDQPWYVNGVAAVDTDLEPDALLAVLHTVEAEMGRVRSLRNAPRVIDLDLLAYHDRVIDEALVVPHPRLAERAFVVLPLAQVAPTWHHPVTGASIEVLEAGLQADQLIRPMAPPPPDGG